MTAPSIRAELAAAVRACNAAYYALDADDQDAVEIVDDAPLDTALLSDDRDAALRAIANWRSAQLDAIRAVAR